MLYKIVESNLVILEDVDIEYVCFREELCGIVIC